MSYETMFHSLPSNLRRIAFVGVAKNCGKTTTFNHVLRRLPPAERVGLMSIGIDGEAHDVLLGTPKPHIVVEPGAYVATAQRAVEGCTARLEYVHSLGIETPLGEVFVGRVTSPGNVVLAGLRHRDDYLRALAAFEAEGLDRVLIDGAYGRTIAAHADLSDAVVVSTGAVVAAGTSDVSGDGAIETIVARTSELLERLTMPVVEDEAHRALLTRALETRATLLGYDDGRTGQLPAASALVGLASAGGLWTPDVDAIAIPGLVSDRVAELLLATPPRITSSGVRPRTLLVPDGTAFHLEPRLWRRLCAGWDVRVLRSAVVVGISINPTSVQGHRVDEQRLREALEARWEGVAVFNPLHHAHNPS